jgi:hypothetical protein
MFELLISLSIFLKFLINPHFYFYFLIHLLSSNLKLDGVKWREKRRVCSVLFFCKVSLLAILVTRLFKLSIENINWFLFLLCKPFF